MTKEWVLVRMPAISRVEIQFFNLEVGETPWLMQESILKEKLVKAEESPMDKFFQIMGSPNEIPLYTNEQLLMFRKTIPGFDTKLTQRSLRSLDSVKLICLQFTQ